jgi:dipeptidyl aminopeptidase/acylaminoacyl peptidase
VIPRTLLFGNPDRTGIQLSPDGSKVSFLAPRDGVQNIWVADRHSVANPRAITNDRHRGIHRYFWAFTGNHILYVQDRDGDENHRVYSLALDSGEIKDLTPFERVQARIQHVSHRIPAQIVVALNNRNPEQHDLYLLEIGTGRLTLLQQNDPPGSFIIDDDYQVRGKAVPLDDGSTEWLDPDGKGGWRHRETIPFGDAGGVIAFDKSGKIALLKDSRGRDTTALFHYELESRRKTLIAEDSRCDVHNIRLHPTEKTVQFVSFIHAREEWRFFDKAVEEDFRRLQSVSDGEPHIHSSSLDDMLWIVAYQRDNGPTRFFLFDRRAGKAQFLFTDRKDLEGMAFAPMHSVVIKSRDGLDLVSYYSLPVGSDSNGDGVPDRPLPMVFTPHGGPNWRNFWGFDLWHQWLCNRGYAVLSSNFRASTGFGKRFLNAGNLEWGGKIIEDQIDAVQWMVDQGIADPAKIAVMGGSFGGYSALAGLAFHLDVFACGVDLVGPSNLITMLETVPPYWKPALAYIKRMVGDLTTEEGRALLARQSPLNSADRIRKPLLIGQGANDPRVKQAESDQIVTALQGRHIPVTYLLYPDEGHGFARPENNLSFNAVAESFLAKFLGGCCEPIGGDLKGSSMKTVTGAKHIPGLPVGTAHSGEVNT